MSPGRAAAAALVLAALLGAGPQEAPGRHVHAIDDFEDLAPWSVLPADGVEASIASDAGAHGRSLRLDVRFTRGTGYAVVRRPLDLDLPADYAFRFAVRGELPVNTLEFKLVDSSGANVWWHVRRDMTFPREWTTLTTRNRQIHFAWGPAGGGEIRHVGFLEFAVTAIAFVFQPLAFRTPVDVFRRLPNILTSATETESLEAH